MANVIFQARLRGALSLLLAATALTACNRDKILQVTDPDIINPSNLGSAEAAEALRVGALTRISDVTGGLQTASQGAGGSLGEGLFPFHGVVSGEMRPPGTVGQPEQGD